MGHLAEVSSLESLAIASHAENVGGITCKLPKTLALTAAVINGNAVALKSFLAAFYCLPPQRLRLNSTSVVTSLPSLSAVIASFTSLTCCNLEPFHSLATERRAIFHIAMTYKTF